MPRNILRVLTHIQKNYQSLPSGKLKVPLRAHNYFESELFRGKKKKKFPDPRSNPDLLIQGPGSSAQIMEPPHLQIQNHLKDQHLSIKEVAA